MVPSGVFAEPAPVPAEPPLPWRRAGPASVLSVWATGRLRGVAFPVRYVADRCKNEDEMNHLILQIALLVLSVLLVLLVLLHKAKGGGLSSLFGGGMQSNLAGSGVAERNLDRITLFVVALWVICIIGTGLLISLGG